MTSASGRKVPLRAILFAAYLAVALIAGLALFPAIGFFGWLLTLYPLPWLTAAVRKAPSAGSVAVVNLLLGWTAVGWVVALAMACRSRPAVPPAPGRALER